MTQSSMTDNLSANVDVRPAANRNITRNFAIATVGITSIGALIAALQIYNGGVGTMELVLLALFYIPTALGIEAGFHRYFSHNAFRGGLFITWMLGIWGSMAAQGPVLFWASTHRKHHSATDLPDDPHSPHIHGNSFSERVKGFAWSHMGWLFGKNMVSWAKYAPDLLRKREIISINQSYFIWVLLGLFLPTCIGGLYTLSWEGAFNGLIWGGLFRIFLLDHVTWAVNSLGHTLGKQPHGSKDKSRNIAWLCLPSVGGSWHNNHHAFPIGARNDHQSRFQIDISGLFIEFLGVIGLVDNIKRYNEKIKEVNHEHPSH